MNICLATSNDQKLSGLLPYFDASEKLEDKGTKCEIMKFELDRRGQHTARGPHPAREDQFL